MYKLHEILNFAKQVQNKISKFINAKNNDDLLEYQIINAKYTSEILKFIESQVSVYFPDCNLYSPDSKIKIDDKKNLIIINVVDSISSILSNLEMSTLSIAIVPSSHIITIENITQSFVMELKSGAWLYSDCVFNNIIYDGFIEHIPNINSHALPDKMTWALELYNKPNTLHDVLPRLKPLIDTNKYGKYYIFNSPTFSIIKVISGQIDAYIGLDYKGQSEEIGSIKCNAYLLAPILFIANKAHLTITDTSSHSVTNKNLFDDKLKLDLIITSPLLHSKVSSLLYMP